MLLNFLTIIKLTVIFFQANHPPVVKIVEPKPGGDIRWNESIRYNITVSDKEDGESRFGEITENEVLLEVKYVEDTSVTLPSINRIPLHSMMASNCMNCHAFNSKLIGPSYMDIGKRYSNNAAAEKELVKHIKEGSKDIWGSTVMPTHPELTDDETLKMVRWIMEYSKQNQVSYITGTEGSIRLKKPAAYAARSAIILTASYLDHNGANGEDKVIITVKD